MDGGLGCSRRGKHESFLGFSVLIGTCWDADGGCCVALSEYMCVLSLDTSLLLLLLLVFVGIVACNHLSVQLIGDADTKRDVASAFNRSRIFCAGGRSFF